MDRRPWLQVAHDVSLAMWFGGALMGAVSLNGATIEVDDHTQRTRVANAGWFRWAPFAGAALVTHVAASVVTGRLATSLARGAPLGRTRAAVTGLAVLATIETGISGRKVVRAGDVPVATAVEPISSTPEEVAHAQRRLRVAQWLVPAFAGALWLVDALQDARSDGRR